MECGSPSYSIKYLAPEMLSITSSIFLYSASSSALDELAINGRSTNEAPMPLAPKKEKNPAPAYGTIVAAALIRLSFTVSDKELKAILIGSTPTFLAPISASMVAPPKLSPTPPIRS